MLQRSSIALAQVKASNTLKTTKWNLSNNFTNSLYWGKEIAKKMYSNIMSSIKF